MIRMLLMSIALLIGTGCSADRNPSAQGYMEGKLTYMTSNANGIVDQLRVIRGSTVKKGTILFVLDQQPESDTLKAARDMLEQSQAQSTQITAALTLSKQTLQRNQTLYRKGVVPKALLDAAVSDYEQHTAHLQQIKGQIAQARAELNKAHWQQTQKTVQAPVDASVFDTYYQPGELVIAGHPVLSLLAPADIKAIFFVSEPQLSALKLGKLVQLSCDGCAHTISAKISFISPIAEYTPPVIYSEATRSKLVFRVEAAPLQTTLHPGQPISVALPSRES